MAEKIILQSKAACQVCGNPVERRHGPQTYCTPACRAVRIREKDNAKRRAAGRPALGDMIPCESCSTAMVFDHPSKRFCPPCRKAVRTAGVKRSHERNRAKYEERRNAYEAERRLKPERQQAMRGYGKALDDRKRDCPRRRMDRRISEGVRIALKGRKAGRKWEAILGFTLDDLVRHLDRQFAKGMGWHNMGEWHIDHIVPKASFSYSSETDPAFRAAWALTNLRPLWAVENIAKKDRRLFLI